MKRLLISAAHKSSGKTTVSIGLCAALSEQGQIIQAFKKGPDYIDPMWLGRATGRSCFNLDFYLSSSEEIRQDFAVHSDGCDMALIEGNKGLYDGLALDGSDSNAALAKLLKTPVVLVVDTRGITRGIAPLLKGYRGFDADIDIAGVILNQVGGSRHEAKLRAAVEFYTDIPVLGAVYRNPDLVIDERHLGLMPSNEAGDARKLVKACSEAIRSGVDLDRIRGIPCPPFKIEKTEAVAPVAAAPVRIAIAEDAAFGFYYPADLETMRSLGVELVSVNMLEDDALPEIDGLFIGGGFPETHMSQLETNTRMRTSVRDAIESGLPVYAECGGLMYLARSIKWGENQAKMVGIIPGDILMHDRPVGRGYTRLQETNDHPWPGSPSAGMSAEFPAHEFHYSSLENLEKSPTYAYKVLRGTGITGENDGYTYKNLLASYVHLRNVAGNQWVHRFVDFVHECKSRTI